MLSLLVTLVFLEINICKVASDWVKISATTAPNKGDGYDATKSVFQSDLLSGVLSENNFDKVNNAPHPSREWVEYQKQRFETAIEKNEFFVDGSTKLKNSARIVVPIVISNLDSSNDLSTPTAATNPLNNVKSNITIVKRVQFPEMEGSLENVNDESMYPPNPAAVEAPKTQSVLKMNSQLNSGKVEENKVKGPSFRGFVEFLKSIQNTLITKTSRSIKDKIKKLAEFRDELLINIEERFSSLWPRTTKTKRSVSDEAGIDFPTAETALMTISFLTFAVFLIKLVLQVIHTIKSKHYNLNAMTMEPVRIAKRSNARTFGGTLSDIEITEHILKAVENVKGDFS